MDKRNVFVLGDLVLDHSIFVSGDLGVVHQQADDQQVLDRIRSEDTAGGAANVARILACAHRGLTFLWGVVGHSRWGTFRDVLRQNLLTDGATGAVELRGVREETEAQMTTMTRVIKVPGDPPDFTRVERLLRIPEVGQLHVPEYKRLGAFDHMRRIHEKHRLDAIVINDLDYGCISAALVETVAVFAEKERIPLLVDPKRQLSKYQNIRATAILPNLDEWRYLVGADRQEVQTWKQDLDHHLDRIVALSVKKLGAFDFHIIKCDRDGAILIGPDPGSERNHLVCRLKPLFRATLPQVGCGDVLAGIVALELAGQRTPSIEDVAMALWHAQMVVSLYLEGPWQRMPSSARLRDLTRTLATQGEKVEWRTLRTS